MAPNIKSSRLFDRATKSTVAWHKCETSGNSRGETKREPEFEEINLRRRKEAGEREHLEIEFSFFLWFLVARMMTVELAKYIRYHIELNRQRIDWQTYVGPACLVSFQLIFSCLCEHTIEIHSKMEESLSFRQLEHHTESMQMIVIDWLAAWIVCCLNFAVASSWSFSYTFVWIFAPPLPPRQSASVFDGETDLMETRRKPVGTQSARALQTHNLGVNSSATR